jgi:hypothetical protein
LHAYRLAVNNPLAGEHNCPVVLIRNKGHKEG